jgi:hypothetical protein
MSLLEVLVYPEGVVTQREVVHVDCRRVQVDFRPLHGHPGVVDWRRAADRFVGDSWQVAQIIGQLLCVVIRQPVLVVDGVEPGGPGRPRLGLVRLQIKILRGGVRDDVVHASPRRRIPVKLPVVHPLKEPGVVTLPRQDHRERRRHIRTHLSARHLDRLHLQRPDLVELNRGAVPKIENPGGGDVVFRYEGAQFLDGDLFQLLDGGPRGRLVGQQTPGVLQAVGVVVFGGGEVFGGRDGHHDRLGGDPRAGELHVGAHHHGGDSVYVVQVQELVVDAVGLDVDLHQEVSDHELVQVVQGFPHDALGQTPGGELSALFYGVVRPFALLEDHDQQLEPLVFVQEILQGNFFGRHRGPCCWFVEPHPVLWRF